MLNVDHLSFYSQVKTNQRCHVKASLCWSPRGAQPEGAGALRACGRINPQPVWMHREGGSPWLCVTAKELARTPKVCPCKSLCPGQLLAPLGSPRIGGLIDLTQEKCCSNFAAVQSNYALPFAHSFLQSHN